MLGDHRGGSTDSRRASVGFVDVDDVVGRAWLRFFPLDTLGILQTPAYPELESAGAADRVGGAATGLCSGGVGRTVQLIPPGVAGLVAQDLASAVDAEQGLVAAQ